MDSTISTPGPHGNPPSVYSMMYRLGLQLTIPLLYIFLKLICSNLLSFAKLHSLLYFRLSCMLLSLYFLVPHCIALKAEIIMCWRISLYCTVTCKSLVAFCNFQFSVILRTSALYLIAVNSTFKTCQALHEVE